jgi:hypothetical protein
MVTIWCACGAVSVPSGNPWRGLPVAERLAAIGHGVARGVVTVTVEPQWHPGGASLAADCVLLFADLDLAAAVQGLHPHEAALVEAAWLTPRDDAELARTDGTAGDARLSA